MRKWRGVLAALVFPVAWALAIAPALADGPEPENDDVVEEREAPTFDQGKVFQLLGDAAGYFDDIASLPESRWFGRDQEGTKRNIDGLIDDALEVMDVPEIVDMREDYRRLESRIASEQNRIA